MNRQFKVGDRVMISKDSRYYGYEENSNPTCSGTVTEIRKGGSSPLKVKVDWDNGRNNAYTVDDLELVTAAKEEATKYKVSSTFFQEAYKSACKEWQKKLSDKFSLSDVLNDSLYADEAFVLEAYQAASSDWKLKLKQQFPDLFKEEASMYLMLVDKDTEVGNTYVCVDNGKTELKCDIQLIDGVAGVYPSVPYEAKYAGFYIPKRGLKNEDRVKYVPKLIEEDAFYALIFEKA